MDGMSERARCPAGRQPSKAELEDAVDIDAMPAASNGAGYRGAMDPPATARV